ncbi:xanthine dehydrogenase [Calothrix sp. HK-06]|nr:xanthine dehydrogenase [Calothrix sp. HK-06]
MSQVLGKSVSRKDGIAKVTGAATYSAEYQLPNLVHGYVVTSTIASGEICHIDTSEAQKTPGVLTVFTHLNAPKIFKPQSKIYEARLPLSDNQVHYAGQIIGVVIADTFERARDAAFRVKVDYNPQTLVIESSKANFKEAPRHFGEEMKFSFGDVDKGMAASEVKVAQTYESSTELHSAMEPHAIIVDWHESDGVTIYEHTQWVAASQRTYAGLLGVPVEKVRIISPYIGGGFGSKAFPWSHAVLCAAAAKEIKQPLKIVLSRRQMTALAGHRSETEQIIRLGATADGTITAIDHEVKSVTSPVDVFIEACTSITPVMYKTDNLRLMQELGVMNVGVPTFMRAPGENPGMWALESAMDELAWNLKIDPIELRLKNETKIHQRKNLPFSAKHFADCLKVGSEKFGWKDRAKEPRARSRDGKLIGWGMAAATYPGLRSGASVKVRLLKDGTAHVLTAGNDMGTGAYTAAAMVAAETLQIPVEKIRVELGDSRLPDGGMAGGSMMSASIVPAIMAACQEVLKLAEVKTTQEAFALLEKSGGAAFEATASSAPGEESKKFAFQSWGAHFCEVEIDESIGRLRVTRWLSVMDIGQVINAKTAASQVRGGVIMGISQALMEECQFDPNIGYPVVYDLATYHYAAHADIPRIDVIFVGTPDTNFNPAGVRGVGEIGITGVSAAVANAVYHATGKRLRSLPLTPDKLLV